MKRFVIMLFLVVSYSVTLDCFGMFAPPNDAYIPISKNSQAMDEKEFNLIIDTIADIYRQEFADKGVKLVVEKEWESPTANAYAVQKGDDWIIHLYGGLARYPGITSNGYAMVVCHEIGHHIGGSPKYTNWWGGDKWASCEGQSDYFAGAKCFKRYLDARYPNDPVVEAPDYVEPIPPSLQWKLLSDCETEFDGDPDGMFKCAIGLEAGLNTASVLATLGGRFAPSLETTDPLVVDKTNTTGYPSVQCRLDTFRSGAFCKEDVVSEFFCELGVGSRPACWYKKD